jgi:hypothetical protein
MATFLEVTASFLAVLLQTGGLPAGPMPEGFSAIERTRLTAAQNVEKRIKIYADMTDDRRRSVEKAVADQNFSAITLTLKSWGDALDFSLADIEANAGQKSKSKALKNYEIRLREGISAVGDLKTRGGSYEQFEQFESWLNHAGEVQKKLVSILFPD